MNLISKIFTKNEISIINKKINDNNIKHIVYCSFENRFAKSGGLGAVTKTILPYLDSYSKDIDAILVTPFYPNIIKDKSIKSSGKRFIIKFDNKPIQVDILEYELNYKVPQEGILREYYIKAGGFFDSHNHLNDPYLYNQNDLNINNEKILINALFFCKALPLVLKELGITKDLILHLQDWQTTLINLTSKEAMLNGIITSCKTIQTMHNSFDSYVGKEHLKLITGKFEILDNPTAFQIGLELVDAPITTVSENFAREFTHDIIQKEHFTPHLQEIFKNNKVIGIDNGMFCSFPEEYLNIDNLSITGIKKIKLEKRKKVLKILDGYPKSGYFGQLTYKNGSIIDLPDEIPLIMMSGRLDTIQKGYDILLKVIRKFKKDRIKFILTPRPVKAKDLDYFKKIAKECYGNLIVFPKNMQHGYNELQQGNTFGVMPSIYEPFGAAIEYMTQGTLVIARKTGGLIDQIDEFCGILYREKDENYNLSNIKNFNDTKNDVEHRETNKWVNDMTEVLYNAIKKSINLYQDNNDLYYNMVKNGFKKAHKFNWMESVTKYFGVYSMEKY